MPNPQFYYQKYKSYSLILMFRKKASICNLYYNIFFITDKEKLLRNSVKWVIFMDAY